MNILLLTSEFFPAIGGIATYAREIATAASANGALVTIAAPDYGEDRSRLGDESHPFKVRRFRGGRHTMRDAPSKILLTRHLVGEDDYDVVQAVDWPFFVPVALARRRTSARLLMTVHGTEINEMQAPAKRLIIAATGVFGHRTRVVANSSFTRDLFLARFAGLSDHVHAVPLGVSEFWFGVQASRPAVRRKLGLPPDAIAMVTVGRLTRRKGHLLTLDALASMPRELRQRIIWFVVGPDGEGEYVNELKERSSAADCDVRFLGRLADEDIRELYVASDFLSLTALSESFGRVEGFGLVFLEAAACGLPSVATAVGGIPSAVINGETGLLVDPSADAVARAITTLAGDPGLRGRLSEQARAYAQRMSWRRCAATTYGTDIVGRVSKRVPAYQVMAPHLR